MIFLQNTGLLAAGNFVVTNQASQAARAQVHDRSSPPGRASQQVLVTSAHCRLAGVIAAQLKTAYQVRLTAPVALNGASNFVPSDLHHDKLTRPNVQGVDAVVLVGDPPPGVGASNTIDYRSRCIYNLLQAAVSERVKSIVYLSSLSLLDSYDKYFQVDEDWRHVPTPAAGQLSYLGVTHQYRRHIARLAELDQASCSVRAAFLRASEYEADDGDLISVQVQICKMGSTLAK